MSIERPVRRDDLELTEVEDGFVAYDDTTDRVHHLNASLVAIFDLADGNRTAADIAGVVASQFELEEHPVADVVAGLDRLQREGLVR